MANLTFSEISEVRATSADNKQMWIDQFDLNDPIAAREFFATKNQFLLAPSDLHELLANPEKADLINIIDVRKVEDFKKGHLPNAINLPRDQWENAADLLKDKVNIVYCYSLECPLASLAAKTWAAKGYPVMELVGGFNSWKEKSFQTDTKVHH